MASVHVSGSGGKTGRREEMTLVAREGYTHLEDIGDSGLRSEDQPRIGLDVGIFSCFGLGCVLPVCCPGAVNSQEKSRGIAINS